MEEEEKNLPVWSERVGSVEVALWENELPSGKVRENVKFSRRYADSEGQSKTASSFPYGDLANVVVLGVITFAVIFRRRMRRRQEQQNSNG